MALENQELNRTVPIPLYFQLKEMILCEIKKGKYADGQPIPTENELSQIFGISRTTVRQAVVELVNEGWLYREKSKGTFVGKSKISQDFIQKLEPFNQQILRRGMVPRTEILFLGETQAPEAVKGTLGLEEEETAVLLYRRRFADEEPIVTVKTYLPFRACSFLLSHDLGMESLYEILCQKDESLKIFRVHRVIEADLANKEDVQYLNIKKNSAVQIFTSTGYNGSGRPLEYSIARYRSDRNKFEVDVFTD